jgi:hypothetical protein
MSTNCIRCVVNKRTGPDLLCEECRAKPHEHGAEYPPRTSTTQIEDEPPFQKTMKSYFVIDVESIGLHGEGFAVAGGVYLENGAAQWEFSMATNPDRCQGDASDRDWVMRNVPILEFTHFSADQMREEFWEVWQKAHNEGAQMAAECLWPVEAKFVAMCVEEYESRKFAGPYPFLEISSVMQAAGMDPMASYPRTPSEEPKHNPLSDARQSARLLSEALAKLKALAP